MKTILLAAAAATLMCLTSTSAFAQALRTWVSGVGDDVNPCSRTAPCKTFAGAISKTASGGIIDVLDPGGFGAVTVTKPITIRQFGGIGSILAAGTTGVVINAANATVTLIGLNIDGAGTGINGVNVINAAQVTILNTTITGFTNAAIRVASANLARVTMRDSTLVNNNVGLTVEPAAVNQQGVVMDNVLIDSPSTKGIVAKPPSLVALRRSTILGSVDLIGNAALRSNGDNVIYNGTPTVMQPLK